MSSQSDDHVTLIGRTNFRGKHRLFGIRDGDRLHHVYAIGKTGTGKSTLMEHLIRQDMEAGRGLALFDPHGDLVERLASSVPLARRDDLLYFDVPDPGVRYRFNPLERVAPEKRGVAASGILEVFRKLWPEFWGPRLEHILRNATLTLLEQPEATLADVLRLLDDPSYRTRAVGRVSNAQVRRFWLTEYESYPKSFRAEATSPVQNKIGAFLSDPVLHGILTQPGSAIDLRRVMDDGRILLVNLAKGRIGEDAASLLGSLLLSRIGLAALSRADTAERDRCDFIVYADEFHSFTTLSLATMLAELRKYRVGLTLAHQYLGQLDERVLQAVLGNVGTTLAFRVGPEDAEVLGRSFEPVFSAQDLVNLPNHMMYVRLLIRGALSQPFSAETLPPAEHSA